MVEHFFVTTTHHWLLFFTNKGRVYRAKTYELPEATRNAKGQHVANILAFQPDEQIAQVIKMHGAKAAIQINHGGRKSSQQRAFRGNGPLTDRDIEALFAFLKTVKPVKAGPYANELGFPFNQRALLAAGYDPGPIDGVIREQTMRAVNAYQAAKGLPVATIARPFVHASRSAGTASAFDVGFESGKIIGRSTPLAIDLTIGSLKAPGWADVPISTVGRTWLTTSTKPAGPPSVHAASSSLGRA